MDIVPTKAEMAATRSQRDILLTTSDWTQVADAPVDQAAWATYRQALRDVPSQAGFPDNVTWPVKPQLQLALDISKTVWQNDFIRTD